MEKAREALKRHFGHEEFRNPQQEIVHAILSGQNTLVIMPTGGGKSLCYQLPALLLEGVTLVVSPLIALMKDQVDTLRARGIPAGMINSSQSWQEQRMTLDGMRSGALKLVYISPERFRAESFVRSLEGTRIAMLAIDEAHCISQWGHDFRPDYMRLGEAVEILDRPLCTAFTATATPEVREDIVKNLRLRDPKVFVSGFSRPNLSFSIRIVERKLQKEVRMRKIIEEHKTGIIYCATRKSVDSVSAGLTDDNIPHVIYHAGMPQAMREAAQDAFVNGYASVAVATSAFGMGIDRSDIRFVCHYEMPGSIEAFYQEAGRAGRDGKPAFCEMLFMHADKRIQEFFIEGANPDVSTIRQVYGFIRSRINSDNEMFLPADEIADGLPGKTNPMAVNTSIGHLRRRGYLERFDVTGERIRGTRVLQPEITCSELELASSTLAEKKRRDHDKLKKVIQMAYARECRQSWILKYFGEPVTENCLRCDECNNEYNTRTLNAEETAIVQKALSGVARMSQRVNRYDWAPRFGKVKIISCLLGSKESKLINLGLDKLSTYGLLKEYGKPFTNQLFKSLEDARLIETVEGEFPLLRLTESGSKVMFGNAIVALEWPEPDNDGTTDSGGSGSRTQNEIPDINQDLYRQLVSLRDQIRRQRGNVPAYTIFPNNVLAQLAHLKPASSKQAMEIKGIGPVKAQSILPDFLDAIRKFEGN